MIPTRWLTRAAIPDWAQDHVRELSGGVYVLDAEGMVSSDEHEQLGNNNVELRQQIRQLEEQVEKRELGATFEEHSAVNQELQTIQNQNRELTRQRDQARGDIDELRKRIPVEDGGTRDDGKIVSLDEHNAVHQQLREAQERERQLTGERDDVAPIDSFVTAEIG